MLGSFGTVGGQKSVEIAGTKSSPYHVSNGIEKRLAHPTEACAMVTGGFLRHNSSVQ